MSLIAKLQDQMDLLQAEIDKLKDRNTSMNVLTVRGPPGKDGRDGQDGQDGERGPRGYDGYSVKGEKGDSGTVFSKYYIKFNLPQEQYVLTEDSNESGEYFPAIGRPGEVTAIALTQSLSELTAKVTATNRIARMTLVKMTTLEHISSLNSIYLNGMMEITIDSPYALYVEWHSDTFYR